MVAESRFVTKVVLSLYFLPNSLDFTETIIPLVLMASEAKAHSAIGLMGYWLRAHSGSRNYC